MSRATIRLNESTNLIAKATIGFQSLVRHCAKMPIVGPALFGIRVALNWIPLSAAGLVIVPLLFWARQRFGITQQDQIVLVATTVGLVAIATLALMVLATAIRLKVWRITQDFEPIQMISGIPSQTDFKLPIALRNPFIVSKANWQSPQMTNSRFVFKGFKVTEEATAEKRGYSEAIIRTFVLSDFLGLCKISLTQKVAASATIEPNQGRAASVQLISQLQAGDTIPHPEGKPQGDLIEMKNYGAGDPLKLVLWKQYARTGRLLVRSHERSIAETERIAVAFVAGDQDEANAGVAFAMLDNQCFGTEFTFCADGATAPTNVRSEAKFQIIRSAGTDVPASSLSRIFEQGKENNLLLFVPAKVGPWIDRLAEQTDRTNVRAKAILTIDHVESGNTSWFGKLFLSAKSKQHKQKADCISVCKILNEMGIEPTIVDRKNGEVLPERFV